MLAPGSRRLARFDITPALLAQCLHMPESAAICDIRMNGQYIEIMADDSELPQVPEGNIVPKREVQLMRKNPDQPAEEIDWEWGKEIRER